MKINHLTFSINHNIRESLKFVTTAFTPRQSVFFMPMAWMIAENISNIGRVIVTAFSESTPLSFLVAILKKVTNMTYLQDVYGCYTKLHQIFKSLNEKDFNRDIDEATGLILSAIDNLEGCMAYLPITDKQDRNIKKTILKKIITEVAEDGDGKIDLTRLSPRQRQQLELTLQLIKE